MTGESMEVGTKCQGNAGECQGNEREWVQSAMRMQGNAGECQGNVKEWVQNAMEMQGNAREKYGSWSKVPGECRRMPGKRKGVGAMCQ